MKIRKINITEIEGFRIGNAEDPEGATGCTVIISEEGAVAGVDVRGGAPATRETDLLRSENTVDKINAVVISGGSAFGLEAGSGVMRALASRNIGYKGAGSCVPIVAGASLFDLAVGRSDVFPDVDMGIQAVDNAYEGKFESGNHGAGTGATVGKMLGMDRAMKSGLGTFACSDDIVHVGAVVAVNACADVYNGAGNIIAGLRTADGSQIQGTIKVLKGMLHPESEPELRFEDIKKMASDEKTHADIPAAPFISSTGASQPKTGEDNKAEVKSDFKSDIARAIQLAYENETAAKAEEESQPAYEEPAYEEPEPAETIPEAEPATVIAEEPAASDADEVSEVTDETPVYEAAEESEPAPSASPEPAEYTEPEDIYLDLPEEEPVDQEPAEPVIQDESPDPEPEAEPEPEPEPEIIAEPDPYELSEEEKADMGYDIPFNTTIGCLITNAIITKSQANKLASILHDAYARAIKPVHSTMDGDTIFVMSTCTQEVNFDAFAALAADVMQYAIIDGAHQAEGAYGLPASRDIIHK
ncbi:MAG: P1 family peptidase [Mogibacterium sp.]|nr:P1 family peptidase [Mogibacterium sp.]